MYIPHRIHMILSVLLSTTLVWTTVTTNVYGFSSSFSSSSSFSMNEFSDSKDENSNQYQSQSQRARKEEEIRRQERSQDNIPGKTSAIPGARDFELNIRQTELQYEQQASYREMQVRQYTQRGMEAVKLLQLQEAAEAFDKVYDIKPNAYCWQAGVVQFYSGNVLDAARTFVQNALLYESKFGLPASEERLWRDACYLKLSQNKSKNPKKNNKNKSSNSSSTKSQQAPNTQPPFIPVSQSPQDQIPWIPENTLWSPNMMDSFDKDNNKDVFSTESRKVIRIARDLFSASVREDWSTVALCRAKLRTICDSGKSTSKPTATATSSSSSPSTTTTPSASSSLFLFPDRKMWKLSSWYFLGLHHDVIGEEEESKICMKMALRQCATSGNGSDLMHILPMLHMTVRDWYDDDSFQEGNPYLTNPTDLDPDKNLISSTINDVSRSIISNSPSIFPLNDRNEDTIILLSIKDTISKMKLTDLQTALKQRNVKSSGSKSILQDRLLHVLLKEAGMES